MIEVAISLQNKYFRISLIVSFFDLFLMVFNFGRFETHTLSEVCKDSGRLELLFLFFSGGGGATQREREREREREIW